MSLTKDKLFKGLMANFLEISEDIEAVIISDHEGFIIAGEKRVSVDMELVSVLTVLINPILERMRDEFAFKKFGTASFDTDEFRLLFIAIDEKTTLSLALKTVASIDNMSPYAFFLAEKTKEILDSSEGDIVQVYVPRFEVESDVLKDSRRIKEQIYQMRLDSGGIYKFKFVIIGDHEVGKTSVIRRFVENKFTKDYRSTLGLNVLHHSIEFYGNNINFLLFDVGAQEFFKRYRKTYYSGAQAGFIVYDITNHESFNNVEKWHNELKDFIGKKSIPIVLVGNKIDLIEHRKVDYQEGVKLINKLSNQIPESDFSFIETSALTGENVEDAFILIAYHYVMKTKEKEEERLREDLMSQINAILDEKGNLTISFITENPYWSPGLQILNEVNTLCECEKVLDDKENRLYEYSNGLIVKNFLFDNIDVSNSDGVFIIFDARKKEHIDPQWKNVVLKIIDGLDENKVALIGIRVSNESDWSKIMEKFDVNEYLEDKMVSLLFFKIGFEYRLEIYDQLEVMFDTIKNLK